MQAFLLNGKVHPFSVGRPGRGIALAAGPTSLPLDEPSNGANRLKVTNNQIRNIDAMSCMDIQANASGVFTNGVIRNNSVFHVWPIDADASNDGEGCGINEYSGTGTFSGNEISGNTVSDAYCGAAHVTADFVREATYFNILYTELNADLYLYPPPFPPAVEP